MQAQRSLRSLRYESQSPWEHNPDSPSREDLQGIKDLSNVCAQSQRSPSPLRSSRERGYAMYPHGGGFQILGILGIFGPAHTNCAFELQGTLDLKAWHREARPSPPPTRPHTHTRAHTHLTTAMPPTSAPTRNAAPAPHTTIALIMQPPTSQR